MGEVDVTFCKFRMAGFGMTLAGLGVAVLPVELYVRGVDQPGVARRGGQVDRVDQSVGGRVDLRQRDLRIFPPAVAPFAARGTNG